MTRIASAAGRLVGLAVLTVMLLMIQHKLPASGPTNVSFSQIVKFDNLWNFAVTLVVAFILVYLGSTYFRQHGTGRWQWLFRLVAAGGVASWVTLQPLLLPIFALHGLPLGGAYLATMLIMLGIPAVAGSGWLRAVVYSEGEGSEHANWLVDSYSVLAGWLLWLAFASLFTGAIAGLPSLALPRVMQLGTLVLVVVGFIFIAWRWRLEAPAPGDTKVVDPDPDACLEEIDSVPGASQESIIDQLWPGLWPLAGMALLVVIARTVARWSPVREDFANPGGGPSGAHWLGTDQIGRDVFARLAAAGLNEFVLGLIVALAVALVCWLFWLAVSRTAGPAQRGSSTVQAVIQFITGLVDHLPAPLLAYVLLFALVRAQNGGLTSALTQERGTGPLYRLGIVGLATGVSILPLAWRRWREWAGETLPGWLVFSRLAALLVAPVIFFHLALETLSGGLLITPPPFSALAQMLTRTGGSSPWQLAGAYVYLLLLWLAAVLAWRGWLGHGPHGREAGAPVEPVSTEPVDNEG